MRTEIPEAPRPVLTAPPLDVQNVLARHTSLSQAQHANASNTPTQATEGRPGAPQQRKSLCAACSTIVNICKASIKRAAPGSRVVARYIAVGFRGLGSSPGFAISFLHPGNKRPSRAISFLRLEIKGQAGPFRSSARKKILRGISFFLFRFASAALYHAA